MKRRMIKTIENIYFNRDINLLTLIFIDGKKKDYRVTQDYADFLISLGWEEKL